MGNMNRTEKEKILKKVLKSIKNNGAYKIENGQKESNKISHIFKEFNAREYIHIGRERRTKNTLVSIQPFINVRSLVNELFQRNNFFSIEKDDILPEKKPPDFDQII